MKKNQTKAYFNNKKIIKWYEYTMEKPEDNKGDTQVFDNFDAQDETVINDTVATNGVHERYGDEEIDINSLDMSDDDKELVASIMEKFKGAKQSSVDSLFG